MTFSSTLAVVVLLGGGTLPILSHAVDVDLVGEENLGPCVIWVAASTAPDRKIQLWDDG